MKQPILYGMHTLPSGIPRAVAAQMAQEAREEAERYRFSAVGFCKVQVCLVQLHIGNIKRICIGKSCWMARLALQQLFPIQILLVFQRFELLQNYI